MMAALMAPIEMPATQSGSRPTSCEGLVGARLVGAERAAALQDEDELLFVRMVPTTARSWNGSGACNRILRFQYGDPPDWREQIKARC